MASAREQGSRFPAPSVCPLQARSGDPCQVIADLTAALTEANDQMHRLMLRVAVLEHRLAAISKPKLCRD